MKEKKRKKENTRKQEKIQVVLIGQIDKILQVAESKID